MRYPARRAGRVAASLLLDTRQRVDRTRGAWQHEPDTIPFAGEAEPADSERERHAGEQLGAALADLVADERLAARDAQIIWLTRVLDRPSRDVGAAVGLHPTTVRRRAAAAERRILESPGSAK